MLKKMNKRSIKHLIFFSVLLFSPFLFSKSNLTINKPFKVLSINGQSLTKLNIHTPVQLKLNAGINRIALMLSINVDTHSNPLTNQQMIDKDPNNNQVSSVFILTFTLKNNKNYRLLSLRPIDAASIKKSLKNPLINIIDEKGQRVKTKKSFPSTQSIKSIHQLTRPKFIYQEKIKIISAH